MKKPNNPIRMTNNLWRAAKNVFTFLSGHGTLRRKRPKRVRTKVDRRCNLKDERRCVLCSKPKSNGQQLEYAHVVPVEEGGDFTVTNILLLCRRSRASIDELNTTKSTRRRVEDVGCHQLYDNDGAWSRHALLTIAADKGRLQHQLSRGRLRRPEPSQKKARAFDVHLVDVEKHISQQSNVDDLLTKLRPGNLKEQFDAALVKWRAVRRGCSRRLNPRQCMTRVLRLAGSLSSNDAKEQAEYERGMTHFLLREFQEASELLGRVRRKGRKPNKWLINAAQSCVAEFEASRVRGDVRGCVKATKTLEKDLRSIVGFETTLRDRWNPRRRAVRTWPVTARLHLARMWAWLGDRRRARRFLEQAVNDRNHRLQAKVWVEGNKKQPSSEFVALDGWSRYSAVLLLHARGEVMRAEAPYGRDMKKSYAKAVEALSFAARRIIIDRYKNYEYLENVWDALLAIPQEKVGILDLHRSALQEWRTMIFGQTRAGQPAETTPNVG